MDTPVQKALTLSQKNACVEFMFAYEQRNVEKMLGFCDENGVIDFQPMGDSGKGKIYELGKGIWTALIDCFPDLNNTLDAAIAEEDGTILCQVVIRGTQQKDFADIPSKGLRFDSDHIFIFHLNDENKIDDIKISWNHEDLKHQLGA